MPSAVQRRGGSGARGHVPTITQEDLATYHSVHFPATKAPAELSNTYDQHMTQDDDGLGYYDDGNKRTLTEDQIAMFRHSEIHALLRERRLRAEAEAEDEHTSAIASVKNTKEDIQPDSEKVVSPDATSEDRSSAEGQSEDLRSLSRNQRRKMNNMQAKLDRKAEEKTNRRLARELDGAREEHVELDY